MYQNFAYIPYIVEQGLNYEVPLIGLSSKGLLWSNGVELDNNLVVGKARNR